ncbi:MAG: hypothetical protein OEW21_17005 [Betaproteobacteria bacterium]|nr:hypothetical protein [Betaproteobacteria bacterium]
MKVLTYWFARLFRRAHRRPAPGYGVEVLFAGWVDLPAAIRKSASQRAGRHVATPSRFVHG